MGTLGDGSSHCRVTVGDRPLLYSRSLEGRDQDPQEPLLMNQRARCNLCAGGHWLVSLMLMLLFVLPHESVSAQPQELEKVRLQLKWRHQFQFAGYYAAVAQGYYRDAGLEVELLEHPLDRSPLEVLLAGEADYVVMGSDLLISRAEGAPLVALAAITQHDPLALLVTAESGIAHPADLRGKRVMLDYGAHDASILAMLNRAGVTLDQFDLQQTSYNPLDLINGKTDAFNAYITDQGFLLDQQGVASRYLHPSRYGIDFYSDILTTTERELRDHPARVERFRAASLKGWSYAMANNEEVIDLILQHYNSQNRSRAHLQYEALQMREMIQPLLVDLVYMHRERLTHIADTFRQLGFLDRAVEVGEILYSERIAGMQGGRATMQELMLPLLLGMVALLLLTLLIWGWSRNLQHQVAIRTNELTRANDHIEQILESMNEGLVVVDGQQQIRRINKKLERLTDRGQQEWIGRPLENLFVEQGDSLFQPQRMLRGGADELIPVTVSGGWLDPAGGEGAGAVLVIHDLRDQHRALQQEELVRFQSGVAEMAAAVLHNIGNVVTGMSGHVIRLGNLFKVVDRLGQGLEHYQPDPEGGCEETREKQLRILQAAAAALKNITSEVGEKALLQKIDQGIHHIGDIISIQQNASRPIIHATSFTLNTLVEDTVNLIEDLMEKCQVELVTRNPLMQLLLNLLKNSLEAIIEEMLSREALVGKITLSTRMLSSQQFEFVVEDNGCGHDQDRLDHLFHSGYTTKQRGSGYGLHSALQFVESIGGTIRADSDGPHQGMTLRVILPQQMESGEEDEHVDTT